MTKTIPEGEGTFTRNGPPKMTAEMRVLFNLWSINRWIAQHPDEAIAKFEAWLDEPEVPEDWQVIFESWKLARTLPTFPPEDLPLAFDAYARKYGIIGPNKERSLRYRETSFSDQWPD